MTEIELSGEQPIIDFQTPFVGPMESYPRDCSQKVDRAKFMSFLTESFSVSRGTPDAHFYYVEWASAQAGQDILQIIREFYRALEAGPIDGVLSDEEQRYFITNARRFHNVRAHNGINDDSLRSDILQQLEPIVKETREQYWENFRDRYSLAVHFGTINVSDLKSVDRVSMYRARNYIAPRNAVHIPHS